jgi:aryl-alcohol dehydrogenase-like predicted oxidoreductase
MSSQTLISKNKLAFGCARLSSLSIKNSVAIIEGCLENNILHFDTAPSYGTENLIGDILRGVKNTTIASKIGLPRQSPNNSLIRRIYKRSIKSLANMAPLVKNKISLRLNRIKAEHTNKRILSMDEIMYDLEKTLINLNKSKIDILLVHEPDQFLIDNDLVERFENLKKQGLIDQYGLGYSQPSSEIVKFGNVRQFLYGDRPAKKNSSVNIVHGLIRASVLKGNKGAEHSQFINDYILKNKNTSVLFSASKKSQIQVICSNID